MLILKILPDEIARGYLGRLRAINGYRSQEETVRVLRQYLGEQYSDRRGSPVACLLAKALQMPMEAFSRQHTMLPYIRAVTIHLPDMRHGEAGSEDVIRHSGMSSPQPGVCFCRSCVHEDMDFWGYAYFRRSHQLPGAICCEKHHEALLWLDDAEAFYRSPYETLRQSAQVTRGYSTSVLGNEVAIRFAAITGNWLSAEKPIAAYRVYEVLRERADRLGLRQQSTGKRKLLSDLAIEDCPPEWLGAIFPVLLNKEPFRPIPVLDGVLRRADMNCRTESYALALAVLFNTADEALREVGRPARVPKIRCISKKSPTPEFWRSQEFFRTYVESRGNQNIVSEKTGFGRSHTKVAMLSVGFPGLGKTSASSLRAFLDFVHGMDLHEACVINRANFRKVQGLARYRSDRFVTAVDAILNKKNSWIESRSTKGQPIGIGVEANIAVETS